MSSENTEVRAGIDEETNEHDYAHAAAGNFTSTEASSSSAVTLTTDGEVTALESFTAPAEQEHSAPEQHTLMMELPEPALGAEVDCPGGNYVEVSSSLLPRIEGDSRKAVSSELAVVAPPRTSRCGRRRTMQPEDRNCSCCKVGFERQGRSFNRRAVYTFTTPETVQWVFSDVTVNEKSFLCETCAQVIRSKCKRKQSGKRSLWLKPPTINQSDLKDKKKKGRRMGKKSKAALLVSKSCYKAAFKMLWSAKGARKPMMEFWSKQLKEEMKALTRQTDNPFHQKVTSRKPLASFPWRRCLNWAQDKAPLVTTCLTSLFPDIGALSKSSHLSEEQAQVLLERRAVVALSIPLFTRNIWKNNFLQAALGAELRLQGCSGSALDALNTMGLCQNKDTVRLLLHRLRNGKKTNGQRLKLKQDQMKGEQMTDVEEEEEDGDDNDEGGGEEEEEMEIDEEEEMQDAVQEEEEEDQAVEEKVELEKKRRKKRAKKQRKEEKRKERGKRKAKESEEEEDDVDEEQKKRRVVVVRLDLLKGHSEVGRSDLSAP